jgi:hypothetical protein
MSLYTLPISRRSPGPDHPYRTVLTFIDVSAPSQRVSGRLSSYLVAIANAGSAVGRLSGGCIADRIGTCVALNKKHVTNNNNNAQAQ